MEEVSFCWMCSSHVLSTYPWVLLTSYSNTLMTMLFVSARLELGISVNFTKNLSLRQHSSVSPDLYLSLSKWTKCLLASLSVHSSAPSCIDTEPQTPRSYRNVRWSPRISNLVKWLRRLSLHIRQMHYFQAKHVLLFTFLFSSLFQKNFKIFGRPPVYYHWCIFRTTETPICQAVQYASFCLLRFVRKVRSDLSHRLCNALPNCRSQTLPRSAFLFVPWSTNINRNSNHPYSIWILTCWEPVRTELPHNLV